MDRFTAAGLVLQAALHGHRVHVVVASGVRVFEAIDALTRAADEIALPAEVSRRNGDAFVRLLTGGRVTVENAHASVRGRSFDWVYLTEGLARSLSDRQLDDLRASVAAGAGDLVSA
ncbi:hypothetical protein [Microbacterium arborescens]|uniref:hypothetical protein n=1 Tax=Microbacterium arborescens TaxID=33883 RepID=UPI003C7434EE